MRHITGTAREQIWLEAPSLDDYVGEDNLVRLIDLFVDAQDLEKMGFSHSKTKETGRPPYHPGDMAKLYIYGYLNRTRSSRRLEAETLRNVEVMWLMKNLKPDDKTICNFRKENPDGIKELYRSFNKICLQASLIGGEISSLDGTKIKADNSRKNRYTKEEAANILLRLDKKVDEYMAELDKNDAETDFDREKVMSILNRLSERKTKFETILRKIEENGGEPVCTTDEEAKLMKQGGGKGFDVCYNVQAAVDGKHGLVVEYEVTDSCNDMNELSGMAIAAKDAMEADKLKILADTGYSNGKEISKCEESGIECYIPSAKPSRQPEDERYHRKNFPYSPETDTVTCPEGNELSYKRTRERDGNRVYANRSACLSCLCKEKCTKSKTLREIEINPYQPCVILANDRAKANPDLYKRRQELSEHPFGVVKSVWGFGQFLCRGKAKTSCETALMFLAFNLRRAINVKGVKKLMEIIQADMNRFLIIFYRPFMWFNPVFNFVSDELTESHAPVAA